jgi:hypothetical protein
MNNEQIIALGLIHPALEVRELAEKLMEHEAKGYRTKVLRKKLRFLLRKPDEYFFNPRTYEDCLKKTYGSLGSLFKQVYK